MLTLIGKRLIQLLPTLFFVSVLIFSLQQLLPGDPALIMAGEEKDPEVIEQIRRQYRLDQPLPVQYHHQTTTKCPRPFFLYQTIPTNLHRLFLMALRKVL